MLFLCVLNKFLTTNKKTQNDKVSLIKKTIYNFTFRVLNSNLLKISLGKGNDIKETGNKIKLCLNHVLICLEISNVYKLKEWIEIYILDKNDKKVQGKVSLSQLVFVFLEGKHYFFIQTAPMMVNISRT